MKNFVSKPDVMELHKAIENDNYDEVVSLINQGVDVNEDNGYTPLTLAVIYMNKVIVELLLNAGADVDKKDQFGQTALRYALDDNSLHIAKILIAAGADIHTVDCHGHTVLHFAVESNDVDFIELLLFLEVDVDSKDCHHQTALHKAALNNKGSSHLKAAKILLEYGADVNLQDREGETPLYKLIKDESVSTEIVQLFLNYEPNVTQENNGGIFLFEAICTNNFEVLKLLVDHGLNVNSINTSNGSTPLHEAFKNANFKILKFLMKHGANIDALDFKGYTPLQYLMKFPYSNNDFFKTLMFLLKYTDFNLIDIEGKNILTFLSAMKNFKLPWKTILEHFSKLQIIGLPLSQSILDTISNNRKYNNYFKKCTEELSMAQSTKIQNSWVSYFNLLVDSKTKLKNYAGNKELIYDFKCNDCLKKFPIFGASMIKNVEKAIQRRELCDQSAVLFNTYLPIFNSTPLITTNMLDCLNIKNLQVLCDND